MEILGRSLFEDDEIHNLISDSGASTSAASFTALLELPPSQAVQLLHPPPAMPQPPFDGLGFSSDLGFFERAARVAVFTGSPEIAVSNSSSGMQPIKCEPIEAETHVANHATLVACDPMENQAAQAIQKQTKRKERGKKGNSADSKKKVKSSENSEEAEKLPYVHVRARRGQATDNHSLAERARREKINARMKLLQELVPGCNKISGTALVLDEIINHVQSLQRQVEFLSMRLATVNPRIDFNLDSLLAADNGSMMENTLSSMIMPLMWQEMNCDTNRQPYQQQWGYDQQSQQVWMAEDGSPNFLTPDLSYDSGNSVSLRRNHVKMEMS